MLCCAIVHAPAALGDLMHVWWVGGGGLMSGCPSCEELGQGRASIVDPERFASGRHDEDVQTTHRGNWSGAGIRPCKLNSLADAFLASNILFLRSRCRAASSCFSSGVSAQFGVRARRVNTWIVNLSLGRRKGTRGMGDGRERQWILWSAVGMGGQTQGNGG
mmetsp:Transcript_44879/g.91621  ORF Transcript_44879/g.91621 Transcript_44879/m.91621 type:complete len:162 (+) Transcript_44879:125-610(+)